MTSVAEAGNDSPNNEMLKRRGAGLQDGADNHDGRAEHDHTLASEGVADKDSDHGAKEASQVI